MVITNDEQDIRPLGRANKLRDPTPNANRNE
jgi:hypothetical protein